METIKLYDKNAYATEFDAKVISSSSCEKGGTKLFAVILDQTLFFPEEGGQTPDLGVINGQKVIDVQISDNVITHYVENDIASGSTVHGVIDFAHRYSNMQQHSGEHIFSGLVYSMFGFNNVGFHLSDNSVTMDYNGVLSPEDIRKVELEVNKAIWKDIEIIAEYPSPEVLSSLEYRSKKELKGAIRIVTIPGYDTCACCAPHVKRTGEIGMLKVIHSQNYKGGVRLHILCGRRALAYFNDSLDVITSLTDCLTTGRENLLANVKSMKAELQSKTSLIAGLKQELLLNELSSIPASQEDVILFKENTDSFIMRNVINKLLEFHTGICAFFSGNANDGWVYIIGSKTKDTREVQKKLAVLGAKGGGKPEMIQGNVKAFKEEIEKALS